MHLRAMHSLQLVVAVVVVASLAEACADSQFGGGTPSATSSVPAADQYDVASRAVTATAAATAALATDTATDTATDEATEATANASTNSSTSTSTSTKDVCGGAVYDAANLYPQTMAQKTALGAGEATRNYSGINLSYISDSTVQGTEVRDANGTVVDFSNATLSNVIFTGSFLDNLNLSNSLFTSADFASTYIRLVNFGGSNLSNANLHCANIVESNFANANLKGADLSGAWIDVTNATWTNADLSGANLTGAKNVDVGRLAEYGVIMTNTILPDGSVHP